VTRNDTSEGKIDEAASQRDAASCTQLFVPIAEEGGGAKYPDELENSSSEMREVGGRGEGDLAYEET